MICGEMCDRPRCNEKCPKPLNCGHPCIGVCGEPCPDICRVCISHEEFESRIPFLFGNEHDEDAHFVLLEDCGHILEVRSLDQWMDLSSECEEVKWKCCPQCKAPVLRTARYANIAKEIMHHMNAIKQKQLKFLSTHERNEMQEKLVSISLHDLEHEGFIRVLRRTHSDWHKLVRGLNDFMLHKSYTCLLSAYDVLNARKSINDLWRQHGVNSRPLSLLLSQMDDFLQWLKGYKHVDMLTDQMTTDINAESRRILLLEAKFKTQYAFQGQRIQVSEEDEQFLEEISQQFETNGGKIEKLTEDSTYERMMKYLQSMPMRYRVPLTIDERRMIIKAIGAKQGSWYKCPKGHYYQIGECGGAMQTSKCPECGAGIGGRNHQLLANNQHAGEFDESMHAAWSEGANLHNFDLDNL